MIPERLWGPVLILCEGSSDCAFFKELLAQREIGGVQLAYPDEDETKTGGRNGFSAVLRALKGKRGFELIRLVLLVSDNNGNPSDSVRAVIHQIAEASDYAVPTQELVPAHAANFPDTMIMMLPLNQASGQLEDLCLIAARNQRPDLVAALDEYSHKVMKTTWSANRKSKAKLRVLLASHYGKPNTGIPYCWSSDSKPDAPGPLIPVSDTVFNEIADKIQELVATYAF